MQLSKETIIKIQKLIEGGLSSREIAKKLGISKSTVNNYRYDIDYKLMKAKENTPYKILFFDLESAPDTAVTFSRFNANFTQEHIVKEGGWLLSAAWATNDGAVVSSALTPQEAKLSDDFQLVCNLYSAIEDSDVVVAHNLHRFDWPLFLARCAFHGLSAPKKVQKIDTLRMAKQMKFQSNRLGSLAKVLGCEAKLDTSGIKLWVNCMNGDKKALKEMETYNRGDVVTLREVYHKLKVVADTKVNLGIYYNDGLAHCPTCGSVHIEKEHTAPTMKSNLSTYDEYYCISCGSRHRSRKANNTKDHRGLQLI